MSSSESWVENLGGPEEINQEMRKLSTYYLSASTLPYDYRDLPAHFQLEPELKCCYKILHPTYRINMDCKEFRKKLKFTLKYFWALGEQFINFTNNDFHGHLRDNTEILRLTNIQHLYNENRKAELLALAFNLEYRYIYLDRIPEIPRAYLEQINRTKNEINALLDNNATVETKVLGFSLLLYSIDVLLFQYNVDEFTASIIMIMADILNDISDKIGILIAVSVPLTDSTIRLFNLRLRVMEKSNELVTLSTDIRREVVHNTPQLSSFKELTSPDYSSSSFKESKFDLSKIATKCENIFKDINTVDGKKFKLVCHKLIDPKYCLDINKIRTDIFNYYAAQYPKIVDETEAIEVDGKNIIGSVFKAWLDYDANYSQTESLFERSIFEEHGFIVRQIGNPQALGEGVVRNTFDLLAKALKTERVFIPLDENSKRYTLNYDYKVNIGVDEMPYERGTKSIQLLFWNFIGEFLQFCLVNNITLDFYLSYSLLYVLLVYHVSKIKQRNLITYYLLDNNNTETRFMIESIRNPENIDEYFDRFNSYNKIVAKDKPITRRNFLEYLEMKAYYQLNNETYNKKYVYSDPLSEIVMGFQILKYTKMYKVLSKNKVNVQTLDRLLSESNVTIDNLKKFTESVFTLPSGNGIPLLVCETGMKNIISYDQSGNKIEEPNPRYIDGHGEIFENFKKIIHNGLRTFPMENSASDSESSATKKKRSNEYLKFMKKLFHFWSASSAITFMPPLPYKVAIVTKDKQGLLPISHTCFYTIDIPDDITSYKELYKKLVISVMNVEEELGLL